MQRSDRTDRAKSGCTGGIMQAIYDGGTDTLTIVLGDAPVVESDGEKEGVILDYAAAGNLVSLEILDASRRVRLPTQIGYRMIPARQKDGS